MRVLVLGGTLFLGRHIVESALAGGHEVTLFHRGRTNPDLFPGVEKLLGDRNGNLNALRRRRWDAVVDTSGYVPRVVRASAELLRDAVGSYTFISSGSVYADFSAAGLEEESPVRELSDPSVEVVNEETYGGLKVLCERVVEEVFPGRSLAVRAGLLVGPHDPTDRFVYWLRRIGEGGAVLAPGPPDRQVQVVHARDVADWILRMAETGAAGVYNVTGPAERLTLEGLLWTCREATGSDARFTWVDESFLLEQGVRPWVELPLWLPAAMSGMLAMDVRKAVAAGLSFRPLAETIRQTSEWDRAGGRDERAGTLASGMARGGTLEPEREAWLLAAWSARQTLRSASNPV